jgi:acyl-CoA thioester hydrolase
VPGDLRFERTYVADRAANRYLPIASSSGSIPRGRHVRFYPNHLSRPKSGHSAVETSNPIDALSGFPTVIHLPVQWGDMDAYQHVNNVVYFRWFESARIAYLQQIALKDLYHTAGIGPILAAIACNYRRQLNFPDTVAVGARINRIGRTSFEMEHTLFSAMQQAVVADGKSTIVTFDYRQQKPTPLPNDIRARIEKFESKSFPA